MLSAVPARSGHGRRLGELAAAVRPEFCGEVIAVSPEDPVFGRGRCGVAGCGRSAWARDLCSAHHQRWTSHGRPDLGDFKESASAVAVRAASAWVTSREVTSKKISHFASGDSTRAADELRSRSLTTPLRFVREPAKVGSIRGTISASNSDAAQSA